MSIPHILIQVKPVITHLTLHILGIVLAIDVAARRIVLDRQRRVAHLRRQAVLQIQEARLTHVLYLRAGLADDCRFESGARGRAGVPAEDGERSSASAA